MEFFNNIKTYLMQTVIVVSLFLMPHQWAE